MFDPREIKVGETLSFALGMDKAHLFDQETGASVRVPLA